MHAMLRRAVSVDVIRNELPKRATELLIRDITESGFDETADREITDDVVTSVSGPENFGMLRRLRDLVVEEHLLVELLTGTDSRELDLDFVPLFETGQPNHVAREIHDFDRLSHVEHEKLEIGR